MQRQRLEPARKGHQRQGRVLKGWVVHAHVLTPLRGGLRTRTQSVDEQCASGMRGEEKGVDHDGASDEETHGHLVDARLPQGGPMEGEKSARGRVRETSEEGPTEGG